MAVSGVENSDAGSVSGWFALAGAGDRFIIGKRQKALPFQRGIPATDPLDRERDDEKDGEQAAEKYGQGKNVHANWGEER
jgi:hypothetical protein